MKDWWGKVVGTDENESFNAPCLQQQDGIERKQSVIEEGWGVRGLEQSGFARLDKAKANFLYRKAKTDRGKGRLGGSPVVPEPRPSLFRRHTMLLI